MCCAKSDVPDSELPAKRPASVATAFVNSDAAGAVVGLFGLVLSEVRSVWHAVDAIAPAASNATECRVNFIRLFSRCAVTV